MRNIMIFAVIGMLVFGCINPPQAGNNTTSNQPIITTPNATAPANASNGSLQPPQNQPPQNESEFVLPPDYSVDLGDQVSVMYALYVDGALYDTNNATLANESGKYNPYRNYAPLSFTAQMGAGMIDGFVLGVIGMHMNETLSFRVDPERGYGPYNPGKVITVPRYYSKNLSETVPRYYFTEHQLEVSNGTSYETDYGMIFIQDFNDENVTIYYASLVSAGYRFTYGGIPHQVVNSTVYEATLERMFDANKTYVLPNPATGQATKFLVTDKNEQNITLDANHALANKSLDFIVTLIGAVPARAD